MKTELSSAKSKEAPPIDTAHHTPTPSATGPTKFGKLHDIVMMSTWFYVIEVIHSLLLI